MKFIRLFEEYANNELTKIKEIASKYNLEEVEYRDNDYITFQINENGSTYHEKASNMDYKKGLEFAKEIKQLFNYDYIIEDVDEWIMVTIYFNNYNSRYLYYSEAKYPNGIIKSKKSVHSSGAYHNLTEMLDFRLTDNIIYNKIIQTFKNIEKDKNLKLISKEEASFNKPKKEIWESDRYLIDNIRNYEIYIKLIEERLYYDDKNTRYNTNF